MSQPEIPAELPSWIADHIKLYYEDPDKAHMWDATAAGGSGSLPTLLLTTTGRKSGQLRPLPLIYKKVNDGYVIIASKGGHPKHPIWYLNLQANPECEVRVGRDIFRATMRVAEGAERADLWQQMVEVYSPYTAYQQRAGDREIPVVILERTP